MAAWQYGIGKELFDVSAFSPAKIMTDRRLNSAIVVDQLLTRYEAGVDPRPHYFYCMRDPLQRTRADHASILASLARQMCCVDAGGDILRSAVELYDKRNEQASRMPTSEESVELIIKMTEARPVTYIVLDALDECDTETRGELLLALQTIIDRSAALTKIFVSSRDDPDIVPHFEAQPHVRLAAAKTKDDIELFIEKTVREKAKKELLFGRASTLLILAIEKALKTGADGMYVRKQTRA